MTCHETSSDLPSASADAVESRMSADTVAKYLAQEPAVDIWESEAKRSISGIDS